MQILLHWEVLVPLQLWILKIHDENNYLMDSESYHFPGNTHNTPVLYSEIENGGEILQWSSAHSWLLSLMILSQMEAH